MPRSQLVILAAALALAVGPEAVSSQTPPASDGRITQLAAQVSPQRLRDDVATLVGFGTRHTLSDTVSAVRGIGAARRWLLEEFKQISAGCGGCLEVFYDEGVAAAGRSRRIPDDTKIVNVVAVQRGVTTPDDYLLITGHYDSRVSDPMDAESDAPGANDDASGTAATLEAARVLSQYRFDKTIVYAALAGEEQGLFGGSQLAQHAAAEGWRITGVLNNDIIGNIEGISGVVDNTRVRVFSEPVPGNADSALHRRHRFFGGEVDGPSRQLARYLDRIAELYLDHLDVVMVYRLDRFGRGGDHRAFNDLGFPAVRITEMHENYRRQHQDLRTEGGIEYGDRVAGIDFPYHAKVVALNVAALASLAWAPPSPDTVLVSGAVSPSAQLRWSESIGAAGYRVYWRETTEPQWTSNRWVGDTSSHTLAGLVVDNYLFGVAAVSAEGNESAVVFAAPGR